MFANGQMSRAERRNLPRQLRADGAAGAGHQNAATLDQALHGSAIERSLRLSEQILDGDGANLQALHEAAAEFGVPRQARNRGAVAVGQLQNVFELVAHQKPEERSAGEECVSLCRLRWTTEREK